MKLFMTLKYLPDSEIQNYHAKDANCGRCIIAIADGIEVGV